MKSMVNKKPRFLSAIVGLLILIALVLVACGGATTSNVSSPTATPTTPPTPTPTPKINHSVGQVITVYDEWEVTVVSAKVDHPPVVVNGSLEKSQKPYVIVSVKLKNISSTEQSLFSIMAPNWILKDLNGNMYKPGFDFSSHDLDGKFQPGVTIQGSLAYEAPESVHQYQLLFITGLVMSWDGSSPDATWDITV
jgi:hypothetical protein